VIYLKAILLFFCLALVTACQSDDIRDYPKVYEYNLVQEKEGITVKLKEVKVHMSMNDQLTTVHYVLSNKSDSPIQIINDEKNDIDQKTGEMLTHYFKDDKGKKYRLRGYSSPASETDKPETEGSPTQSFKIKIPSPMNQVNLEMDYDAFDIKSFEWRIVITLENGETIPFTFKGEFDKDHLIKSGR
jgi:hypothetical protein